MMEITDFTQEKKARIRQEAKVMCGACKATGLEHQWNAQADLVPVSPPRACHCCGGSGKVE